MKVVSKVRMDSSIYGYAEPGDVMDIPPKLAKEMMDVGYVEPLKETKPERSVEERIRDENAARELQSTIKRRGRPRKAKK